MEGIGGKRVVVTGGGACFGAAIADAFGGAGARVVVADASADARALIQTSVETLGGLDILVNAVHGAHPPVAALDMSIEEFDAQVNLNVRSVFLAVKYAVPHMLPGSVIVNISSTAHRRPRPMLAAYNASVGSLITMTRALAAELGPRIRVNAVCVPDADRPAPMGREVAGQDVAAACLFLAAPRSAFLTGVCLEVNGGRDIE
jgi:3-oxoacyl-[acyl-carrier protein] reductase